MKPCTTLRTCPPPLMPHLRRLFVVAEEEVATSASRADAPAPRRPSRRSRHQTQTPRQLPPGSSLRSLGRDRQTSRTQDRGEAETCQRECEAPKMRSIPRGGWLVRTRLIGLDELPASAVTLH